MNVSILFKATNFCHSAKGYENFFSNNSSVNMKTNLRLLGFHRQRNQRRLRCLFAAPGMVVDPQFSPCSVWFQRMAIAAKLAQTLGCSELHKGGTPEYLAISQN